MRNLRTSASLLAAVLAGLVISGCGGTSASAPSANGASSGSPAAPASSLPTAPGSTAPGSTAPGSAGPTAGLPAGYLPLYPFASLADARAWQASYQSGGHQPWHRSPTLTATGFAAWLGYTGVSEVASSTVSGSDAHVAIGIKLPNGTVGTAAIIHLVQFGPGQDAPWEVVGTDDRTFTVDRPVYGSTVRSPLTASGTITGVDENIRVTVHTLSSQLAVGSYCCQPAGGTRSPWSATLTFQAAPGRVITVAAATGGHVAAVERFAVTGARVG